MPCTFTTPRPAPHPLLEPLRGRCPCPQAFTLYPRNLVTSRSYSLRRCSRQAALSSAAEAGSRAAHPEAPPAIHFDKHELVLEVGDRKITLETGEIGRQASGAVMARDGDTMIYTTACCDAAPEEGAPGARHGSPLQVHYAERFSAAGRTSGGYVKRDGRAKEHEILISRLVDRPLRPLLPADWRRPTQVLSWVLSFDGARGTEALAVTAAGAALALSAVPIRAAVAAVRVGLIPGRGLVLDPDSEEVEASVLDLLVAGSAEGLLMVEAGAEFVTEADMLEAIAFGQAAVQKMCVAIDAWAAQVGKPAAEASEASDAGDLEGSAALDAVRARFGDAYETLHRSALDKAGREAALRALRSEAVDALAPAVAAAGDAPAPDAAALGAACRALEQETARRLTAREGVRMDGRAPDAVRGISCRAGALPRTHGSALFTRGETQVLAVATLGCEEGVRRLDSMAGQEDDRFYLQYFFPPSCVGETGRQGPAGRREIGHGALAQRALAPAVPPEAEFPYSIRLESTVTESNGSSSMATVCAGCLALLDAGVPLKGLVAGVAMGLVLDAQAPGGFRVLTDILGAEDALGDMDFKVAGDAHGISALQLDVKAAGGITGEVAAAALGAARAARLAVLRAMGACAPPPRGSLAAHAPRLRRVPVPAGKLGLLIGAGGRTLRALQAEHRVSLQLSDGEGPGGTGDDGAPAPAWAAIRADSQADADAAAEAILALVDEPERGRVYRGARVTQVLPFGALVEVAPRREGLLHLSEWAAPGAPQPRLAADVAAVGDAVDVQILDVLDGGKLRLSRKALLDPVEGYDAEAAAAAAAEAGAQRGNGGADDGARYKRRRPRGEGAGNGAPRRYARGPPRERQASPDSSAASADTTA
uniref:polyribonucleotide nucleotidyltransferase n=3 Tax=Auxenochlorella protothecoides TaxID=3075 RepID=A0A1D1ZYT7_AUXPR